MSKENFRIPTKQSVAENTVLLAKLIRELGTNRKFSQTELIEKLVSESGSTLIQGFLSIGEFLDDFVRRGILDLDYDKYSIVKVKILTTN